MWKAIIIIAILLIVVVTASKVVVDHGILHKNNKNKDDKNK